MKEPIELEIVTFSKRGLGRAYHENIPVDIPGAVPGDRVKATLGRKRKEAYRPFGLEWVERSPDRISPPCPHFDLCGGCKWQQLPYELQLAEKQRLVESLFGASAPIIGCETPWRYRNKMEFSFSSDRAGNRYLGLCMGKGRVLNLEVCHIAPEWMADLLEPVRLWWELWGLVAYHPPSNTGLLRALTLREGRRTGDRLAMLTTSDEPLAEEALVELAALVGGASFVHQIQRLRKGEPTRFIERTITGSGEVVEELTSEAGRTLSFRISPTAFFQPNTNQAECIYQEAIRLAKIDKESSVLDLYCGTGTLGLFAATVAKRVIGVEINPDAVRDARANAELNGLTNVDFFAGDVADWLRGCEERPDVAIIDPPRAGLGPVAVGHLLRLRPEKITYVSCNPATQADDVKGLVEGGYQVDLVQPVDQFPHTVHLENIVVLSRT